MEGCEVVLCERCASCEWWEFVACTPRACAPVCVRVCGRTYVQFMCIGEWNNVTCTQHVSLCICTQLMLCVSKNLYHPQLNANMCTSSPFYPTCGLSDTLRDPTHPFTSSSTKKFSLFRVLANLKKFCEVENLFCTHELKGLSKFPDKTEPDEQCLRQCNVTQPGDRLDSVG